MPKRWSAAVLSLLAAAGPASGAAVVELFTSQACPNCPLAEVVIGKIDRDLGKDVVVLAYHVDFLDSPRFQDRFSRPEWTRRQEMYARPRFDPSLKTPEAIVDGKSVFVGSDERALREAIAASNGGPRVGLTLGRGTGPKPGLEIRVDRGALPAGPPLDVWVATLERHTVTPLRSRPRPLDNDFVVHRLRRAGRLDASQAKAEFTLPTDGNDPAREYAVFVQDKKTLAILGAARETAPLSP